VRGHLRASDTTILILATAAAVALLHVFRSILWPFALAVVLTILIQAFIRAIVRAWPGARRSVLLLLGGASVLAVLLGVELVVLPGLTELRNELPVLSQRLDDLLVRASSALDLENPITLETLTSDLDRRAVAAWMFGGLQRATSSLILTALFVIFLLTSSELIERRLRLAIGHGDPRSHLVLGRTARGIETYLWVQTITGLINGSASGLVMLAVGLDHWLFWAIAIFALSYIPFIGVAVGSVGPALFAILQFPTLWQSAVVFLGIQAIAFVVGNLVWPKLQADKQNMDPSVGLLSVGVWSIIWGLPGAFLGAPLTLALIYQLAGSENLRWIAILLSNDGDPLPGVHREGRANSP
jgi:predicted PurR-regulated permease PerM